MPFNQIIILMPKSDWIVCEYKTISDFHFCKIKTCHIKYLNLRSRFIPVQENVKIRHDIRKSNYVAMKVLLLNLNECVCGWKQSILYPRLNTIVILIYMPKDTKKCEKQRKSNQSKRGIKFIGAVLKWFWLEIQEHVKYVLHR